jgi:geranylgeranyl diphosphate synthase type II
MICGSGRAAAYSIDCPISWLFRTSFLYAQKPVEIAQCRGCRPLDEAKSVRHNGSGAARSGHRRPRKPLALNLGTCMSFPAYLAERRSMVDTALDLFLPIATTTPERLHEAIRYSMLAPGKRLRPILVLASAEAVGGAPEAVLRTACAMECIHVFSLIHDDLPCMDNDDYRRGRLTNHKVYGEAMAMLAGDALLTLAFELIADNAAEVAPSRVVAALKLISNATGTCGMVGGQVVDIESEGKEIGLDTLEYIHSHKTGALLTASSVAGAMLSGASASQLDRLRIYGGSIGLAFQIADDILDVIGDQEKIGKPVGSDESNDKATYPKLFGLDESRRMAQQEVSRAVAVLDEFGAAAEPLRAIARYIVERDL